MITNRGYVPHYLRPLRADLAVARSSRERIAARLLALSRTIPGGGALLWLVCGADIPARTQIGIGLRLPHGGRGVVIHPNAVIGDRVIIYHGVTIGEKGRGDHSVPTIEDDVRIGPGAGIIGGITLGKGCQIGINAVVTKDVPPGAVAVGNPATIMQSRRDMPVVGAA